MSFQGAVEHIAAGLSGRMDEPQVAAFVGIADRVTEAADVQPLVERFIDYEINPPSGGPGIGRYASRSFIPPLGELLGSKRVGALSPEESAGLRTAAERSVAEGYVGMLGPESDATFDGRPLQLEDLWNIWVVRLHGDDCLDRVGLPQASQDILRSNARTSSLPASEGRICFRRRASE